MGVALCENYDGWTGKEVWMEVLKRSLDCRMGQNLIVHMQNLSLQVFARCFAETMMAEMVTDLLMNCQMGAEVENMQAMNLEDLKDSDKIKCWREKATARAEGLVDTGAYLVH